MIIVNQVNRKCSSDDHNKLDSSLTAQQPLCNHLYINLPLSYLSYLSILVAFLVAKGAYESDRIASLVTAYGARGRLSAIPFCPIEAGNLITLTIRFIGFELISIADGTNAISDAAAASGVVAVLPELVGLELTIVLGKEDTLLASSGASDPYEWMAAISA